MLPPAETPWCAWTHRDTQQSIPQRFTEMVHAYPHHTAIKTREVSWD